MIKLKRLLLTLILFSSFFLFTGCGPTYLVVDSLGTYVSKSTYSSGGFQDYSDYHIYKFEDPDIDDNPYLTQVTNDKLSEINMLLDDFETWVELERAHDPDGELSLNYNFDRSIIDTSDYSYIESEKSELSPDRFTYYNVYIFDTDSNTLYFFHNNI